MTRARARYQITAEDRTGPAWRSAEGRVRRFGRALGGIRTAIAGAVGAGGLGLLIVRATTAGDRVQKLGKRLQATTEFLSQMGFVAETSGTDLEAVGKAMQFTMKAAAEAAAGTKDYAEAFEQLGIPVEAFASLSPEKQFFTMAEALSRVQNESDRTNLAMKIMGRSGTEMLQIFEGGTEEMRKLMEQSDALGKTLSQDQANALAAATDAWTNFKTALGGIAQDVAVALSGPFTSVTNWLSEAIPNAVNFAVDAFYALRVTVAETVKRVLEFGADLNEFFGKLPGKLGAHFRRIAGERRAAADRFGAKADALRTARDARLLAVAAPPVAAGLGGSAVPLGPVKTSAELGREKKQRERSGLGRQIDLKREAISPAARKSPEALLLEQIREVLKDMRDSARRPPLAVTAP